MNQKWHLGFVLSFVLIYRGMYRILRYQAYCMSRVVTDLAIDCGNSVMCSPLKNICQDSYIKNTIHLVRLAYCSQTAILARLGYIHKTF